MHCILSAASLGISVAMFSVGEVPVVHQWQRSPVDDFTALRGATGDDVCPNATLSNNSSVEGGEIVLSVMEPLPEDVADGICCQIAGYGSLWTNVKYRPSKKYRDQFDYICTVYKDGKIVAGNDTTTAAQARPVPPPPDHHCAARATIDACIVPDSQERFSPCAWYEGGCHAEPPIDCGRGYNTEKPFCLNIILADHALPGGPAGRQLGSFNWTEGTISAQEPLVVQPTQVLELGGSNWWSVGSGYVKNATGGWDTEPFQVCVKYNELLKDGTADINSWFGACASGPGMWDFTRGASSKIDQRVYMGGNQQTSFWGTWVFWSNETVSAEFQV